MTPSSNIDRYIPQTITLGCIMALSLAVRSIALSCGADGFTAFGLLALTTLIVTALFFAFQSLLFELCEKWLTTAKEEEGKNAVPIMAELPQAEPTPEPAELAPPAECLEVEPIVEQAEEEPAVEAPAIECPEAVPPPAPSAYEQYREETLQARAEAEQAKLEVVTEYTQRTLAPYMSEAELNKLCLQISFFLASDWADAKKESVRVSPEIKSIDLMHFGWNIAQPFKKSRKEIASFLKQTFAQALADVEVSTLQRKLTNTEGKHLIRLQADLLTQHHLSP